jgi:hypothetical protein
MQMWKREERMGEAHFEANDGEVVKKADRQTAERRQADRRQDIGTPRGE